MTRIETMSKPESDGSAEELEDLREVVARLRRERDERLAIIRETKFEVEPHPGLQALVDSQPEFRERVMGKLRRALYG
jgi:hypothetical protein